MSKVRQEVEGKEYYKDIHFLYTILGSLKDIDEVKKFMKDMLTKSELIMLKRRWHVVTLLAQGLDMRTTAKRSQCSTQTISRIKNILEEGYGGFKIALERVSEKEKEEKEKFLKSTRKRGGSKFVKGWFR